MRKVIHHLRRQPEHVRRHILNLLAAICAIVLGALWIYSLGARIDPETQKAQVSESLKPLSAIKDNIIGGYHSLSNSNILKAQ